MKLINFFFLFNNFNFQFSLAFGRYWVEMVQSFAFHVKKGEMMK